MAYQELPQPRAAALYCRLSYAPDGSLEKVDVQEERSRELAARLGWTVCCVYKDNSKSAWQRHRKRPDWDKMLPTLGTDAPHRHDGLLTYHGDRLMRQPWDLELLLRIAEDQRMPLASVSGVRDLSSADDRFILRIEVAAACRESDNISRRVQDRQRTRREKLGLTQVGGRRPFGYGVQVGTKTKEDPETGEETEVPIFDTNQPAPGEFELLRKIPAKLLAGKSQASVVRWMTEKGFTTTEGGQWTTRGLRHLLLAPRVAGLIEYQGVYYKAAWPAAIERDVWEQVRAYYQHSGETHGYAGRERRYLLSGKDGAECAKCHAFLRVKPSGGRNRKTSKLYYCPDCKRVNRNLSHLDLYVEGRVLRLLNDPRLLDEIHATEDTDGPTPVEEIADLERRKKKTQAQLEDLADHPNIDAGLAMRSLASFDRRIRELRDQMARTTRQRLVVRMMGISREAWEDEPIDARAAVVRALYQVIVHPTKLRGPGFDTDAVQLVRRPLRGE